MQPRTAMGTPMPDPTRLHLPAQGKVRAVIESVSPQIDCGRFPIKRALGEAVRVQADVFADGHDSVACDLLFRPEADAQWLRLAMAPLGSDRWAASFNVDRLGRWLYRIEAWVDHFETWRRDLVKRHEAGQDLSVELLRGAQMVRETAERARDDAPHLRELSAALADAERPIGERYELAFDVELARLMREHPDPALVVRQDAPLGVGVDPIQARFSTWYEMFPRSCAPDPGRHGTLRDCEARLPYVAGMGFDVLYLPPIHPIGTHERKGRNNRQQAEPDDVGSPWAIGARAGGHKAIHAELGTLEDFRSLVARARELGIALALDLAFQCSPEHPYVTEHPDWFLRRPDGSIQYAENPPKKYQDIYPFHFETDAWPALWQELKSVLEFWIAQGVRIFRVDNPHTKAFDFWEWLIASMKREHPDIIFLSEAFTRPKVMQRLAKLGFTQSYTYFAWRNGKHELIEYFTELTQTSVREYLRPNLWPNTPDILTEYLQFGGRNGFMVRLVLAATLGASYGIYGPAFELMEHEPREPGSEEYLDSEKYQVRHWDLERPDSLSGFIARVNRVRHDNPALHTDATLRFHEIDNDALICYSKRTEDFSNVVLAVVNLDPHHAQAGWLRLDLDALGLDQAQPFQAHDLLTGARFLWLGARNYVALDPARGAAHVLLLRRRVRSERDFDYFM
jgi:starch synthase (maltosyl-transferring)